MPARSFDVSARAVTGCTASSVCSARQVSETGDACHMFEATEP
jgi:hypothetical protein